MITIRSLIINLFNKLFIYQSIYVLIILLLINQVNSIDDHYDTKSKSYQLSYYNNNTSKYLPKPIRIAFLITGQLARLELTSKIRNIFIPNARIGHQVDIIIFLDNQVDQIKQTFWKFDYSNTPFIHYDEGELTSFLYDRFEDAQTGKSTKVWVRLDSPSQDKYQIVGSVIPVADKIIHKTNDKMGEVMPEGGIEKAADRFQNNMRWLSGLRDCMKWVQKIEYEQQMFYDVVVRLRDDSYVFDNWVLNYEWYGNKLTSARTASFRGVNDHNFVVDRKYADDLFRGLTEDYYFNKSLAHDHWGNPEHRIYLIANAYNIPIQNNTICQQPIVPLRGLYDPTHWLMHTSYAKKLIQECNDPLTKKLYDCKCDERWIHMLNTSVAVID